MKKAVPTIIAMAVALSVVAAADARSGGGGRGPKGRDLVIGKLYDGRGYWDGHHYWLHRQRWHGGWRYRN